MRLQSATLKRPQSTGFETSFVPGRQGFLLTTLIRCQKGNSERGHRLIFTYTYQTLNGVELPEYVAVIKKVTMRCGDTD